MTSRSPAVITWLAPCCSQRMQLLFVKSIFDDLQKANSLVVDSFAIGFDQRDGAFRKSVLEWRWSIRWHLQGSQCKPPPMGAT